MTGRQLGVAAGSQVPPVFDGRADEAGFIEAPARTQQQRMASFGPQHIGGRVLQAGRRSPAGCPPSTAAAHRRARLRAAQLAAARAAGSWTCAGAASLIAAWSAELIEMVGGTTARLTVISPARSMASSASQAGFGSPPEAERGDRSAQVRGHRRRAEDGSRNPVTIKKRDKDQHKPNRRARQQRFRLPSDSVQVTMAAEGTSPASRPDLLPSAGEIVPVIPAGQGRVRDHRGGLGKRQRLAAERFDQVNGALALDRVRAEPFRQAVEGLADAEEPDRDDLHPAPPGDDRRLRVLVTSTRPAAPLARARPDPPSPTGHRAPPARAGWFRPAS